MSLLKNQKHCQIIRLNDWFVKAVVNLAIQSNHRKSYAALGKDMQEERRKGYICSRYVIPLNERVHKHGIRIGFFS